MKYSIYEEINDKLRYAMCYSSPKWVKPLLIKNYLRHALKRNTVEVIPIYYNSAHSLDKERPLPNIFKCHNAKDT